MLRYKLLHPEILAALGAAGHGSQVLITDANYPFSTGSNPAAHRVFLNLMPGLVSAMDTLRVILDAVPVEAAHVMQPAEGPEPPIFGEFRQLLPAEITLQPLSRADFYAAARQPDLALLIATGEQRLYANVLLTIGVRPPEV